MFNVWIVVVVDNNNKKIQYLDFNILSATHGHLLTKKKQKSDTNNNLH